ncbi:LysE family transporter [Telmatospirillum sp.]|uniref:LysE family transporter n=1 Tax=Telmatospirillum sp. TaxID=2079197 RepID=UPI00284E4DE6|nr:LysE family transporter [Telmatospirillum sp.]MDR3436975.1 LysE family transporter [Telmatospirillum sp.]
MPDALFVTAVAALLAAPGPTNALLARAGATAGLRHSLRLVPIALCAYLTAILAWGCLLAPAATVWPQLPAVMRVLCSLLLGLTALRLWRAADAPLSDPGKDAKAGTLGLATLLNPKCLLFAGGIFPRTAFSDPSTFLIAAAAFTLLLLPTAVAWIAFGAFLFGRRSNWGPAVAHRLAALLLAFFSATIGLSAVI